MQSQFQRYECKYLVTETVAKAVAAAVLPFVVPDEHARRRPGHTYPICSLYLDSVRHALAHETVEGQLDRFKLRIRAYSDEATAPVFLEIKRRRNQVVHKSRCRMPRQALPALLAAGGAIAPPAAATAAEARAFGEFVRLMLETAAVPTLLVRYDREAYVGGADPEARVTFDRRLVAARTPRAEVRLHGADFQSVETGMVVLELKFNRRCPAWLDAIVHGQGLQRRSFSKYARCLAATGRAITSVGGGSEP